MLEISHDAVTVALSVPASGPRKRRRGIGRGAFALMKIDLKTFLIVALVFGFPFLFFVIAGVVGLFRGY